MSIEVTRECPLHCPGCYAYEEMHLGGGGVTLRTLRDSKGADLVRGVLEIADRLRPMHISLVGGDPLVRYRELGELVPQLLARNIHVQVVTSAFRPLPSEWPSMQNLNAVVSIDGLRADHDLRRAPATYDRILKNIEGQRITVHCTITGQMMKRAGYFHEFLSFWTPRPEIERVWFSLFTPQVGDRSAEILQPEERRRAIAQMLELGREFPKLDMPPDMIRQFASPPRNPGECIFARTTRTISADLKTVIRPCQFGGNPDCSSCGCAASMGLAAVGAYKAVGFIPLGALFRASVRIGRVWASQRAAA